MKPNSHWAAARGASLQVQRAALVMGTALVVAASLPMLGRISLPDLASLAFLAAVLWTGVIAGPGAGAIAAVAATAAYTLVRIPDLMAGAGANSIMVRALSFGLVGLGTGFLVSRLQHVLGRMEGSGLTDALSDTFSAAYMHQLIELVTEEHRRYGKAFGLIEIPAVLTTQEVAEVGKILRRVTRSSDAVGRSEDGGFLILLPNANKDSVRIVVRRLKRDFASIRQPEVPMKCYAAPEDLESIERLMGVVRPAASSDLG